MLPAPPSIVCILNSAGNSSHSSLPEKRDLSLRFRTFHYRGSDQRLSGRNLPYQAWQPKASELLDVEACRGNLHAVPLCAAAHLTRASLGSRTDLSGSRSTTLPAFGFRSLENTASH